MRVNSGTTLLTGERALVENLGQVRKDQPAESQGKPHLIRAAAVELLDDNVKLHLVQDKNVDENQKPKAGEKPKLELNSFQLKRHSNGGTMAFLNESIKRIYQVYRAAKVKLPFFLNYIIKRPSKLGGIKDKPYPSWDYTHKFSDGSAFIDLLNLAKTRKNYKLYANLSGQETHRVFGDPDNDENNDHVMVTVKSDNSFSGSAYDESLKLLKQQLQPLVPSEEQELRFSLALNGWENQPAYFDSAADLETVEFTNKAYTRLKRSSKRLLAALFNYIFTKEISDEDRTLIKELGFIDEEGRARAAVLDFMLHCFLKDSGDSVLTLTMNLSKQNPSDLQSDKSQLEEMPLEERLDYLPLDLLRKLFIHLNSLRAIKLEFTKEDKRLLADYCILPDGRPIENIHQFSKLKAKSKPQRAGRNKLRDAINSKVSKVQVL